MTARDLLGAARAIPTPLRARTRGGVILRRTRAPATTPPATYYNNASRPVPIISRLVPAAHDLQRTGHDGRSVFIRSVYRHLHTRGPRAARGNYRTGCAPVLHRPISRPSSSFQLVFLSITLF